MVEFTTDAFVVHLEDGRSLAVPLEWFPRLRDATPEQRNHYEVIGRGIAIHWPELRLHFHPRLLDLDLADPVPFDVHDRQPVVAEGHHLAALRH